MLSTKPAAAQPHVSKCESEPVLNENIRPRRIASQWKSTLSPIDVEEDLKEGYRVYALIHGRDIASHELRLGRRKDSRLDTAVIRAEECIRKVISRIKTPLVDSHTCKTAECHSLASMESGGSFLVTTGVTVNHVDTASISGPG